MPTIIKHCQTNIVTLNDDETIAQHCGAGDIVLVQDGTGWWTHFIGSDGQVDSYDAPFENYNKALWAAKAAAEFDAAPD